MIKKNYPDIITAGSIDEEVYYTNSTNLPVDYTADVFEAILHQNDLQTLYTGGTVFHTYIGESISDMETLKKLIVKLLTVSKLPYVSITPTFSICSVHGYIIGEQSICPECGKETEVYSRIVGYFRPIKRWNKGKQVEFNDRKLYL